eukprot:2664730-Rhodomonas_salina.4
MGSNVEILGSSVQGLGPTAYALGSRVHGLGSRVQGLGSSQPGCLRLQRRRGQSTSAGPEYPANKYGLGSRMYGLGSRVKRREGKGRERKREGGPEHAPCPCGAGSAIRYLSQYR